MIDLDLQCLLQVLLRLDSLADVIGCLLPTLEDSLEYLLASNDTQEIKEIQDLRRQVSDIVCALGRMEFIVQVTIVATIRS